MGPPDTDHAEGDREVPAPPHSSGVVPLTQPEVPKEKDDESREWERRRSAAIDRGGQWLSGRVHYISHRAQWKVRGYTGGDSADHWSNPENFIIIFAKKINVHLFS